MNEQYLEVVKAIKMVFFETWQPVLQAPNVLIATGYRFYIGENVT